LAGELLLGWAPAHAAHATVEAATYEGSEKVSGVVVNPEEVEIHIVARYPLPKPIPEIARSIMERVAPQAGDRRTVVVVEDLEVTAT
jgi:hypothetical protein